jgi:hypothetical protein
LEIIKALTTEGTGVHQGFAFWREIADSSVAVAFAPARSE